MCAVVDCVVQSTRAGALENSRKKRFVVVESPANSAREPGPGLAAVKGEGAASG